MVSFAIDLEQQLQRRFHVPAGLKLVEKIEHAHRHGGMSEALKDAMNLPRLMRPLKRHCDHH